MMEAFVVGFTHGKRSAETNGFHCTLHSSAPLLFYPKALIDLSPGSTVCLDSGLALGKKAQGEENISQVISGKL